jgi:hypothetical protein
MTDQHPPSTTLSNPREMPKVSEDGVEKAWTVQS